MKYPNILEENIYSDKFSENFLIIGSCVSNLYPEIIESFKKEWKDIFSFCLEQFHYNQLMSKLFDLLALEKTKKIGFLTVDGSPHCVQMHYCSKYLKRGLKINDIIFEHYVIKKDGVVFKVEMDFIDKARHLADNGVEIKI